MSLVTITSKLARKVDNMAPETKGIVLGSLLKAIQKALGLVVNIANVGFSPPIAITFAVTADATGGLSIFAANCPYNLTIKDVIVECTTSNASGTLKLTNGTNDISDAITCAVDKVIDRAGTIDNAYSTLDINDSLKVVANGAADKGTITIIGIIN